MAPEFGLWCWLGLGLLLGAMLARPAAAQDHTLTPDVRPAEAALAMLLVEWYIYNRRVMI